MTKKKKEPMLTIMVPVYNEEKTLQKVLNSLLNLPIESYEVIVVDDCSKDKSPEIIKSFSHIKTSPHVMFKYFSHDKNSGKGAAIKTALTKASGKYFVVQDADLEYNPKDIPTILSCAVENEYPVVYGSRFMGSIKDMPLPNYYANKFYNILIRLLYRVKITDMHTCYKMVRTDIMQDMKMTSDGFDYATELVSKLLKRGIKIREVPISFKGRTKKQGKKINYNDGIECTYQIFAYKIKLSKTGSTE